MPEELTVQLGLIAGPDGAPMVSIVPTWCGVPGQGDDQVAPLLKLGTLLDNTLDAVRYGTSLAAFDAYLVNGQRTFMETCWLPALDSGSIDILIEAMAAAVSPGCAIFTHEFRGAAARVPAEATAFGLRRDHVLVEILATFVDRSDQIEEQRHRQWARAALQAFDAMALPGGYPNLLAGDDPDRAAQSYGRNAARLIEAKRYYDPDNVFRSAIPLPVSEAKGLRSRHHLTPARSLIGGLNPRQQVWHAITGLPKASGSDGATGETSFLITGSATAGVRRLTGLAG